MTRAQRIVAACVLAASFELTFAIAYFVFHGWVLVSAGLLLLLPWIALLLTRRLQRVPPRHFQMRGLILGLGAVFIISGVLLPSGPRIEALGLTRGSVAWDVVFTLVYFVAGSIGAFVGATFTAQLDALRVSESQR